MKNSSAALAFPYPGLRPFDTDDAPVFFGREPQVEGMLRKLEDHRFVAVVGSSGSGKSSLVRAGLIPAIQLGFLFGVKDWFVPVFRPGSHPFDSLAQGLLDARNDGLEMHEQAAEEGADGKHFLTPAMERGLTAATLRSGEQGLVEAIAELGVSAGTHTLLVVDQFEEIFAFRSPDGTVARNGSRDEAADFVNLLLATTRRTDNRIWIVLTMRSDFIGQCDAFLELPEAVSRSQFLVPRLDLEQMEEAIVRPGRATGLAYPCFGFAEGLVKRVLNDTGNRQDVLPLMQHALMRTWRKAEERPGATCLTLDDYERAGGIENTLSQHADQALDELAETPALVAIARDLFLLLSEVSADGQIIRRRPAVQEVMRVADASLEEVRTVVEAFQREQRNFIHTSPEGEFAVDTRLDVSHEALLRRWGKLNGAQGWLASERRAVAELRRLVAGAELYRAGQGELLTPKDLDRVRDWLKQDERREAWACRYITAEQWRESVKYFEESCAAHARDLRERNDSKHRLEASRRLHRNLLICLSLALAFATAYAGLAVRRLHGSNERLKDSQFKEAVRVRGARVRSDYYRGLADQLLGGVNPPRAFALRNLANALRLDPGNQSAIKTTCRLLATDDWCVPLTGPLHVPSGIAGPGVTMSEDGIILVVGRDGNLYGGDEKSGAFTVRQSVLAVASESPSLSNASQGATFSGSRVRSLSNQSQTTNGNLAVAAPATGTPAPFTILPQPKILEASFSDDGSHLLVFPDDPVKGNSVCTIWKRTGKQFVLQDTVEVGDKGPFHNVAWAPDGKSFMLTRWDDPHSRIYQMDRPQHYDFKTSPRLELNRTHFCAAGFRSDGKLLAVATYDETDTPPVTVQILDVVTLQPVTASQTVNPAFHVELNAKRVQLFFLPGTEDLAVLPFGKPPAIINLTTGQPDPDGWKPHGAHDMPTRFIGDPDGSVDAVQGHPVACVFPDRIELYDASDVNTPIRNAIFPQGNIGGCSFNPQGTRLATITGSSFMEMNSVRVWDMKSRPPAKIDPTLKESADVAPNWLADLASLVSGQEEDVSDGMHDEVRPSVKNGETHPVWHPVRNFQELAEQRDSEENAGGSKKFQSVWQRYFPPQSP